jgi:hypothetical protein
MRSCHAAAVETERAVAAGVWGICCSGSVSGMNYEDGGGGSGAAVRFILFLTIVSD